MTKEAPSSRAETTLRSARTRKGDAVATASHRTTRVARAGIIAATYAAATLVTLLFLQGLAWGPVQFRISEAVCVVAILSSASVPGLTVGCVIANLFNVAINGTGALGMLDVVFGSLATLLGALWCRRFRNRPAFALFGFVLANALIVPAYQEHIFDPVGYMFPEVRPSAMKRRTGSPTTSPKAFGCVWTGLLS